MTERKYVINAKERFYKQQYCGCSYSLRDSNAWRAEHGMDPIEIGGDYYYSDPSADAAEESCEVVEGFFEEFEFRNQLRKDKRRKRLEKEDSK